jgi:hypothetical protein
MKIKGISILMNPFTNIVFNSDLVYIEIGFSNIKLCVYEFK